LAHERVWQDAQQIVEQAHRASGEAGFAAWRQVTTKRKKEALVVAVLTSLPARLAVAVKSPVTQAQIVARLPVHLFNSSTAA
jgi:hypothetical protein